MTDSHDIEVLNLLFGRETVKMTGAKRRKSKESEAVLEKVKAMLADGAGYTDIVTELHVGTSRISALRKEMGIRPYTRMGGKERQMDSKQEQYRNEIDFKPYTPRAKAHADFVDDAALPKDYPAPPTCSMPKYHVEYRRQFGSDSVSVTFSSETVDQLVATVKELQDKMPQPKPVEVVTASHD